MNINGYYLVFLAALLWSLSGVVIKTVDMSATWIIFIRSVSGGLLLLPFLLRGKIEDKRKLVVTGVFFAIFFLLFSVTTKISTSVLAVSMQYAAPMYMIFYGFIKYKNISKSKFLVFSFLLIGVGLNLHSSLQNTSVIGVVTGFFIGIFFIFYTISLKEIKSNNFLGVVGGVNLVAAGIYLFVIPFDFYPVPANIDDVLVVAFAGVFISAISYVFYGWGVSKIPVEKAMIVALTEPILNPVWVFLAIGEYPDVFAFIGLTLILLGAIIDICFIKKT